MSARPTRAEVDECMRMAREEQFGADDPTVYMRVLAAEVQALREEKRDFDALSRADDETRRLWSVDVAELLELRATIARVEALGSGPGYRMGDSTLVTLGAVRAAMRGEP